MSENPIYDALENEYQKPVILSNMREILMNYSNSIENFEFEMTEEDWQAVPLLMAGAAKVVAILLADTLEERQTETDTDREFAAYVGGILDTLEFIRTLPPPPRVD